ncbi:hypothetical protein QWI49_06805 [Acinetobacter nosocomialis]|uniref:hypothetical protein n=1 Tax=Acinetobacter nosocomialis TaxID=106654 RepID=UPI001250392A|nr:hypothetical protein [Acinetobacter nosocomialis]MDP7774865.1 hypothetical protein [Acinetobacter nosocomialis]
MKKLSPIEYRILVELFKASNYRLQAFTLSQRVILPFSKFLDAVTVLSEMNLIKTNGAVIELTQSGFYLILAQKKRKISIREIPKDFLRKETISLKEFYVPRRSLM